MRNCSSPRPTSVQKRWWLTSLQKAQEAITELYLSEGKKRATVWKRLASHLEKVGLPADQIEHLREKDDPEMVANILKKFV